MRSPFTGIVFALELTHDFNLLLPLLVANVIAYGFTILTLKRSILTEKIARRGYHLSREYSVDPLEILFAREVMRTSIVAFPASQTVNELAGWFRPDHSPKGQHLYPVVDADRRVLGVITRKDIRRLLDEADRSDAALGLLARPAPVVAYTDEPLRLVVYRMAENGIHADAGHRQELRWKARRLNFAGRLAASAHSKPH